MSEPTRDAYQGEVDKSADLAVDGTEYGTIGWANNPNVLDLGTGGDDTTEEGPTLFRVTLYRGRLPGGEPLLGKAEGHEVLAHFLGPLFVPFQAGQRVALCWPERFPGAPALILGTVGASPATKFGPDTGVLAIARLVLGDPSAGSGLVEISPTGIALGDGATDAPALASKVDANFTAIVDFLTLLVGPPALLTYLPASGPAVPVVYTGADPPEPEATASEFTSTK